MLATATLICHPATPCRALSALSVALERTADGVVLLYQLQRRVDADDLRVPGDATGAGVRRDGLWQHTCLELFVRPAGGTAYREFNFSPNGDWAVYDFSAARQRAANDLPPLSAPRIHWHSDASGWTMRVELLAADLYMAPHLELNLSAVIEAAHGQKSYWALRHPAAQPDFHHSQAFTLVLDETP